MAESRDLDLDPDDPRRSLPAAADESADYTVPAMVTGGFGIALGLIALAVGLASHNEPWALLVVVQNVLALATLLLGGLTVRSARLARSHLQRSTRMAGARRALVLGAVVYALIFLELLVTARG